MMDGEVAGSSSMVREAQRRDRFMRRLLELFTRAQTRKEYLEEVADLMHEWTGCRGVGLRVLDEGNYIPYGAFRGFSQEFWQKENMLHMIRDECVCTRVMRGAPLPCDAPVLTSSGSVRCENAQAFVAGLTVEQRGLYRGECMRVGFKTLVVAPVRYRGSIMGAVHLVDERPAMVSASSLEFVESMGHLLGEAMHRFHVEDALRRSNVALKKRTRQLREIADELAQAEQRERERLASVLHDHLQQLLVGAKLRLSSLRRKVEGEDAGRVLADVEVLLQQSVDATRSLSVEVAPPVLQEGGLLGALEWLGRWMKDTHGLDVDLCCDANAVAGPGDVNLLLFYSVRELLFNVVKHAQTNRATVVMQGDNGRLDIEVRDEGAGFEPEAAKAASAGGFGIAAIRRRLEILGGSLSIDSTPGEGSRCRLSIPVTTPVRSDAY